MGINNIILELIALDGTLFTRCIIPPLLTFFVFSDGLLKPFDLCI